jgi:hypothetical protein
MVRNEIVLGICVLAVLIFFLSPSTEYMTNEDLVSTLKTFGEKGTKPTKKKVSGQQDELPIYGPKGVPSPPEPKPTPSSSKGGTSDYPEIFGPDIILTPGKKSKNGKHESDKVEDKTYDFNPDLRHAFPTTDSEPQPFLGDFSKIQH